MLGFLYVFHIPINEFKEELRFLRITILQTTQGRRAIPLLEFFHAFCILNNRLLNNIRFLTITVLHAPLGQASYHPSNRDSRYSPVQIFEYWFSLQPWTYFLILLLATALDIFSNLASRYSPVHIFEYCFSLQPCAYF